MFEEMCEDGLLGPGDYVIFKIGRPLIGQGMGTSVLRMGWF